MSGFLYYVPQSQSKASAKNAMSEASVELAFVEGLASNHTAKGPDNGGGFVLGPAPGPNAVNRDVQEWMPAPGKRYWVGVARSDPPKPCELARDEQLPGHPVKLGDGNEWLIPVARRYVTMDGDSGWIRALPRSLKVNDEGHWEPGDVIAQYRPLWEEVLRVQELFQRNARGDRSALADLDFDTEAALVVLALKANYFVDVVEASLLQLVDTKVFVPVMEALSDMPGFKELEKKAQASGMASTVPGAAD